MRSARRVLSTPRSSLQDRCSRMSSIATVEGREAVTTFHTFEGVIIENTYISKATAARLHDVRSGGLDGKRVFYWNTLNSRDFSDEIAGVDFKTATSQSPPGEGWRNGGVGLLVFGVISLLLLCGCVKIPAGIEPITGFELNRYLGTWYEIARLDHPFERGLNYVSAEYSMRDDGGVRVLNKGKGAEGWQSAEGRAYFAKDPGTGYLKVAFFGPFFGAYVIFDLSPDYQTAYVCGPNRDYLWLLSRTPTLPQAEIDRFVKKANSLGFDTDALIFPDQKR